MKSLTHMGPVLVLAGLSGLWQLSMAPVACADPPRTSKGKQPASDAPPGRPAQGGKAWAFEMPVPIEETDSTPGGQATSATDGQADRSQPQTLPPPRSVANDDEFDLSLPGPERLFRPESEAVSLERIRQSFLRRKVKVVQFPKDAPLPEEVLIQPPPPPVLFASVQVPCVICRHPLYFEVVRTERYGEYTPLVQPLLSTAHFWWDAALWPPRMLLDPPWIWQCYNP
jgi:hypothetical protein